METILIKRKNYEVLEQINERCYKLTFKGKTYFGKKFLDVKTELKNYVKELKFLASCGLNVPKVLVIDKKSGFVLTQFIEGINPLDELLKGPLSDNFYQCIFSIGYRAKLERININFSPENFILSGDKMYYMSREYHTYVESENFVNKYVRLWFYTTELVELLRSKELPVDTSRLKVDYAINKEIVLTTVKFYM